MPNGETSGTDRAEADAGYPVQDMAGPGFLGTTGQEPPTMLPDLTSGPGFLASGSASISPRSPSCSPVDGVPAGSLVRGGDTFGAARTTPGSGVRTAGVFAPAIATVRAPVVGAPVGAYLNPLNPSLTVTFAPLFLQAGEGEEGIDDPKAAADLAKKIWEIVQDELDRRNPTLGGGDAFSDLSLWEKLKKALGWVNTVADVAGKVKGYIHWLSYLAGTLSEYYLQCSIPPDQANFLAIQFMKDLGLEGSADASARAQALALLIQHTFNNMPKSKWAAIIIAVRGDDGTLQTSAASFWDFVDIGGVPGGPTPPTIPNPPTPPAADAGASAWNAYLALRDQWWRARQATWKKWLQNSISFSDKKYGNVNPRYPSWAPKMAACQIQVPWLRKLGE